jgi:hypothetical protein
MTDNPGRDGGLGRDGGSPGWQMTGEAFRVAVEAHSRRVADLAVYVRQPHAGHNLAELGALVAGHGTQW